MGKKAKRIATAGATFGLSEIARGFGGSNSVGGRPDSIESQYGQAFGTLENYLLSYDDLVKAGRIAPGSDYFGLSGDQSRLGRALTGYEETLAGSSPIFAGYRDEIARSAAGLATGGIPDDFRRSITEHIRGAQAARGTIDSSVAATEEAIRLMGGQEQVRASRLADVQGYLSGVTGGALGALMPGMGPLLQLSGQNQQLNLQRAMADAGMKNQIFSDLLGAGGFIGGMALGGGGGMAAAGGGNFRSAPSSMDYRGNYI